MHREVLAIVQREQRALPQLERLVNKLLPRRRAGVPRPAFERLGSRDARPSARPVCFQHPYDDFHIVLAKAIQPQPLAGGIEFPVGPDLGVAVAGGPFADVRVKALAIPHHGRQQQQVAAPAQFALQPPAQFIPRLGFDGHLAVRAELRAQPREQQPDEMVDFRDRGHGALAAAAAGALLDADRGRDARDQVHVRPGQLLHELPGIDIHGVQEAPLPLGEEQVKRQRALPEPLTPVTTTNRPRGTVSEIFFRLCSRAPWIAMACSGFPLNSRSSNMANSYHTRIVHFTRSGFRIAFGASTGRSAWPV